MLLATAFFFNMLPPTQPMTITARYRSAWPQCSGGSSWSVLACMAIMP